MKKRGHPLTPCFSVGVMKKHIHSLTPYFSAGLMKKHIHSLTPRFSVGLFLLIITLAQHSFAQMKDAIPTTSIYTMSIGLDKKGKYEVGDAAKITDWQGYNNQPWFTPDGLGILYVSIREEGKADIFKYVIADNKSLRIISTPTTAEYSPQLTPDKTGISVVRVMEDDSTQLFYKFIGTTDEPVCIFPKLKPVGYYAWIDLTKVAFFILGEPTTLQIGNTATGEVKSVASNVGRCIQKMPGKGGNFSYVDKSSEPWTIKQWDMKAGEGKTIVKCLPNSEDYCWLPDGTLLMGSGSILYKYLPGTDDAWVKVKDFKDTPLAKFYRLAANAKGTMIAAVTYEGDKP